MNFIEAFEQALQNKDFVQQYDRLTNSHLEKVLNATGINAQIDKSTGFKDAEILKFMAFYDEVIWSRLPPEAFE